MAQKARFQVDERALRSQGVEALEKAVAALPEI
jgi:hypothetical protein